MVAFSFLKFIHSFNLPFFMGTTTMGDNHVAYSIDSMNQFTNNLVISCLIALA